MPTTIFERCGGFAQVRKVVSGLYDRLLDSPRLQRYFAEVDMRALIDHQTKFVAQIMEGPAAYGDEALRRIHAPLGISQAEFREMIDLFRDALDEHGLAPADIDHLCRELARREPFIVTRYD